MSDKNIYQRINAVMEKIAYVQKDASISGGGPAYKAVTHDNVTSQLRKHLVEEGIVILVEQLKSEVLIKRDVKNDIKMHLYSGDYAISFVNMDKPEDRATVTINAQAADNGDKAPGKAASYATKYAMLKMFSIETGENEESRTYEAPEYTDIQKAELDELLESNNAIGYVGFSKTAGNDVMMALNSSFAKGTISQTKAKMKKLEGEGWGILKDYAHQIGEGIDAQDKGAVSQLVDELAPIEKRLVAGLLDEHQLKYLKKLKEVD